MVGGWRKDGKDTRVLGYINPFVTNPVNMSHREDLFQEGVDGGFFVMRKQKQKKNATATATATAPTGEEVYMLHSASIPFAMVDFTNPDART